MLLPSPVPELFYSIFWPLKLTLCASCKIGDVSFTCAEADILKTPSQVGPETFRW
jgi:hypothetical protein